MPEKFPTSGASPEDAEKQEIPRNQFPNMGEVRGRDGLHALQRQLDSTLKLVKTEGGPGFRKNLALDMRSIADPALRREALKSEQGTWRYKQAEIRHRERTEATQAERNTMRAIDSPHVNHAQNVPEDPELLAAIKEWAEVASGYYYDHSEVFRDSGRFGEKERDAARNKVREALRKLGYEQVDFGNDQISDNRDELVFAKGTNPEALYDYEKRGRVDLSPDFDALHPEE